MKLSDKALAQRRTNVAAIAKRNREKTHCLRGHEYTPENTIKKSDGRRQCRTCHRDACYYYTQRKKFG